MWMGYDSFQIPERSFVNSQLAVKMFDNISNKVFYLEIEKKYIYKNPKISSNWIKHTKLKTKKNREIRSSGFVKRHIFSSTGMYQN